LTLPSRDRSCAADPRVRSQQIINHKYIADIQEK
jgi:hypothetical protein